MTKSKPLGPPPTPVRTGTSLHRQVYLVLRDRLTSGAYQPDEQLPPEQALCDEYGVSRITLRRAVEDLQNEGLLERVHGKGTFARSAPAPASAPRHGHGYIQDLRELRMGTTVRVLELAVLPAPPTIACALQIAELEPAHRSVRIRLREGRPVMLLTAWMPMAFARKITRTQLEKQPLVDILAKSGVRFGRLIQEITASLADPVQAGRLETELGAALLQVDRLVHDQHEVPVQHLRVHIVSTRGRMLLETPSELADVVDSGRFIYF